ncbi:MAG: NAD(P)-dependent oxidoreductase [Cyclobacteriaceae bacterium]
MVEKKISPQQTKIGWVGTGVMGRHMFSHILNKDYQGNVFNRTKVKAEALISQGAQWCDSPKEVADNSDVIFSIVGYPQDVEEVYFGDHGILAANVEGKILVDMTTTTPSLAEAIAEEAKKKGCVAVDAPVSGGDVGAQKGTLSIMIGGDKAAVDSLMPMFELLGKNIVYQGPAGKGQHTKMCNQITIAGTMIGVCESLLYGSKAGLDLNTMLDSISKGAAGCWTLDNLAPRIVNKNFDPGFFIDHFIKDMGIALQEANRMGLSLPGLALVHQIYKATQAQGHGNKGTHALMLALETISNHKI